MLFTANTANAGINFGVKGGLNVTSMSLNSEVFDASNRAGFFFGPTVKFTLPIVGWASTLRLSTTSVRQSSP